jgi:hypothetical protein
MTDDRETELVNECNKLMDRIDELGHAKNKLLDRVDQLDRRLEKREADCDKYRSLLFRAQPEIADDHIRQEVAEELK